mmetsp:Transcript_71353/g.123911  ORF Transcript_71353/g.123911 Transcript_71353/m.123911 type:complete len:210 (-) Transcript_71353:1515-2144(-)
MLVAKLHTPLLYLPFQLFPQVSFAPLQLALMRLVQLLGKAIILSAPLSLLDLSLLELQAGSPLLPPLRLMLFFHELARQLFLLHPLQVIGARTISVSELNFEDLEGLGHLRLHGRLHAHLHLYRSILRLSGLAELSLQLRSGSLPVSLHSQHIVVLPPLDILDVTSQRRQCLGHLPLQSCCGGSVCLHNLTLLLFQCLLHFRLEALLRS